MRLKLLAGVAVIATGFGLLPTTPVAAPAHAAPSPLAPCSPCLPGPGGGPGGNAIGVPGHSAVPETGGGPKTGHPSIAQRGASTTRPIGN
jgi:hypothetical protein